MSLVAFFDIETNAETGKILDIGCIRSDEARLHKNSIPEFSDFIKDCKFICGHNILQHDLKHLKEQAVELDLKKFKSIDTLLFSPLLFPKTPYHRLLKDDKIQTDEKNNPFNDSIKARELFIDEVDAFNQLDDSLKIIYYNLLNKIDDYSPFLQYIGFKKDLKVDELEKLIKDHFLNKICSNCDISALINNKSISLAYALALINCNDRYSITPPWILKFHPDVEQLYFLLCNSPCLRGCDYCDTSFDPFQLLKDYFGHPGFRTYNNEALQENAVRAAINNKSMLTIFPTGGGKSITFQIPALMSGRNAKALTVVISPLQSLMKDQVDNMERKGITEAVTINGLLDTIERSKAIERVENGNASILYISPESLRSVTIERLFLKRKIARFVIDEAHCLSSWGQDFRVDYLYIGDFIKNLQQKKNIEYSIPVSCFTATAKQKVIEDIRTYFKEKLNVDLEVFRASSSRTNLQYKVFQKDNEDDKYNQLRLIIEAKNCPSIIYVSRTRKTHKLSQRLSEDGFLARPFNGKMGKDEKTTNQNAFMSGEVDIMVATSAFGMGVDKSDVGAVIHYDISDSLENYVQEAGRAGRDENITAECFVLFNEEDLDKHFILLNQTKLDIKEINQIWKAVKDLTRTRAKVSNSALEIARKAGWDEGVNEIETRVTTAIAALEDAGYLKRGQNMPRVFANSILSKNAQEAIEKINASQRFEEKQKEKGIKIIKKLFSSKSRKQSNDEAAESRIDYISDHLGIVKEEVINIVNLLREEKILADAKDLTAFIKSGENVNRSLKIVETFGQIENFLLPKFEEKEKTFHIKELNEDADEKGCKDVTPNKIKTIINFWAIKNWIKRHNEEYSRNHVLILCVQPKDSLKEKLEKRHELAKFLVEFLYEKSNLSIAEDEKEKEEVLVEFSVHELKN